jgi:hypothetical protein
MDLLDRFHMTDCKFVPTPFFSRIRLEDDRDTPLVDNTLYQKLVGVFCISPTPIHISHMW